jgi:hypothetical protein
MQTLHMFHIMKFVSSTSNNYNIFSFIKEIVSRDLHICFWYHSIDLKFLPFRSMFFCFLNFVFVLNVSILVSRGSEWHLVPVRGPKAKYFSLGFTLVINKSSGNSKYGAAKSPGVGQLPSSKFQNFVYKIS